jgi:hypothetical protein
VLYSIARLLDDLLSVRDRELNSKLKFWPCGISCGCCNGRCAVRAGVPATAVRPFLVAMLNYLRHAMERATETRLRLSTRGQQPRVAALLTGDLSELPALRAAVSAAALLEAEICISWVGPENPGRHLTRELVGDARAEELDMSLLSGLLLAGRIRTTVVPAGLWRRTAPTLWPILSQSSVLVCRRGTILPSTVLVCADNEATEAALMARVASALPGGTRLSVVRAIPPPSSWALALWAMYGFASVISDQDPPANSEEDARGVRVITVHEAAADAIRHAWQELLPELVVLGWHHHGLPQPASWLHPTAWRLSNQLAADVLLVPA